MQKAWVQSLDQEEPTAREQLSPCTTIEPVSWTPGATTAEAQVPRACAPQQEEPPHCSWRVDPTPHNQRKVCTAVKSQHRQIKLLKCMYMEEVF